MSMMMKQRHLGVGEAIRRRRGKDLEILTIYFSSDTKNCAKFSIVQCVKL